MNPCDFVIFLSLFSAIRQHQRVCFHFCEDGSTHSDFKKGTCKLSRRLFNWSPNCSPCSCPSTDPQHSSQSNPPKSHSEYVSPTLNLSNGFETNTMDSKTYTDRPPPSPPSWHHFLFLFPSIILTLSYHAVLSPLELIYMHTHTNTNT